MTTGVDDLEDLDPDDRRPESQQIANRLRAAILTGTYKPGDRLPSQHELARRYGVVRETAKAAIRVLDSERLTVTRQGSGTFVRVQVERPVGLRPHVEAAFGRAHVSIDFAGFSGETLHNTLMEVLDKVRAGRFTPESLTVRILLTDTNSPLAVPSNAESGTDDPAVRERSTRITRRAIESLTDAVIELGDMGLVKATTIEVRVHAISPTFKLYILNNEEVFFGFYPVAKHPVTITGQRIEIFDVMGKDATLFQFSTGGEDDSSMSPQFVRQARGWFDSIWSTIAKGYEP